MSGLLGGGGFFDSHCILNLIYIEPAAVEAVVLCLSLCFSTRNLLLDNKSNLLLLQITGEKLTCYYHKCKKT